ncbi:heavy metal-associated domain-containing protein [Bacillus sp. 31A1R]|uniref:Copper chaperone CopZ n=1 Tax=Robertmurraya mangrovi TaxID=3098077 RepID=A0ABU5J0B6_9BACI|nr:heavy metal-associated domain-containing protein [Bacillus sp. 31A1R]MDZ5472858.1 heavy metal-associated domain-containing protein [Bacillus sp. 31A1R]
MKQMKININGMSCGSCVRKIEGSLQQLNGVEHVEVQLQEKKAVIEFSPDLVDEQKIINNITELGYKVLTK